MRFIDLGTVSPEYSVCADKVLFDSHLNGSDDTMMVYTRDRHAISLGRFGSVNDIRDGNINIVRRISGGGSIYSDTGQMTYSAIFGKERVPGTREDSFKVICGGLVTMFRHLGIEASYKPINDILVNGKKISGSAQYRRGNSIIQHGTVILRIDREGMERHLVSKKGPECITSAEEILGYVPERTSVIDALKKGFRGTFGEITDGELSDSERKTIEYRLRNSGNR